MQLNLTTGNYWHEVEDTVGLSPAVKDQLKAMVNSHMHRTIPPTASRHMLVEIKAADITVIHLKNDRDVRTQLEITAFIPDDDERYRTFTYLRPAYLNGKNIAINQL